MTKQDVNINVVEKIIEALSPLTPEERKRVIAASLMLLGEDNHTADDGKKFDLPGSSREFGSRAQTWIKQNDLSIDELESVFLIKSGAVEVIVSDIPGKGKREKTHNAYILTGIAKLLSSDTPSFDDKTAREVCSSTGCIDNANHAKYLKDKGNEFSGSKDKGWMLTAPGLKRGAVLIKDLNK